MVRRKFKVPMFPKPTVLHISYDKLLLETRTAILRRAGYAVISASTLAMTMDALRDRRFDLVLIGH